MHGAVAGRSLHVPDSSPFRGVGVLVTGASSGIGVALARQLAAAGARLVLTARRADRLEATAAECRALGGPFVATWADDLADPAAPARVAHAADERLQGVDLLVNNAGFSVPGLFERSSTDRVAALLQVNVSAPVALARILLPAMLQRRRGWLLNVSSLAGILPAPFQSAYAGSKAFLLNWSESLREEVRPRGVVVTALCPGVTDTEFFEAAGYRGVGRFLKHRMAAEPVARAGLAALARGRPRVVPGLTNKALAFAGTRLSPRWLVQYVSRKLMAQRPPPERGRAPSEGGPRA